MEGRTTLVIAHRLATVLKVTASCMIEGRVHDQEPTPNSPPAAASTPAWPNCTGMQAA